MYLTRTSEMILERKAAAVSSRVALRADWAELGRRARRARRRAVGGAGGIGVDCSWVLFENTSRRDRQPRRRFWLLTAARKLFVSSGRRM